MALEHVILHSAAENEAKLLIFHTRKQDKTEKVSKCRRKIKKNVKPKKKN